MPVYLLNESLIFPHPMNAEPGGLLAVGGDLSVERLLLAYRNGIFPWYSEGDPIMWFSPDPRLVLALSDLYVSTKLRKLIRANTFDVRYDNSFEEVITLCANASRKGQDGTWITDDMIDAYIELHQEGYAHSVETYYEGRLVGGLYGLSLGGAFFGESMFHLMSDSSKVALYYLVRKLRKWDFDFIDSQVSNDHMKRMGGREISRETFLLKLGDALDKKTIKGSWDDAPALRKDRL
ncbi:MAG: leucyl/phenylalanyl-tRNA--protein transferase [Deltaproteobacteria bacterium]